MTRDEIANAEMAELIEEYRDQNKMWNLEGDSGLKNFNKLCEAIGYKENQFRSRSPLEVFLSDNPGAIERLVGFIAENGESTDWIENLADNIDVEETEEVAADDE